MQVFFKSVTLYTSFHARNSYWRRVFGLHLHPTPLENAVELHSFLWSKSLTLSEFLASLGACTLQEAMTSCNMAAKCGRQPWFTAYILVIHTIVNWHLSKQGIHWPVSHDHFAGSSWELIEVTCFLKLTADQVLVFDWIAGSCQVRAGLFRSRLTQHWNLTKV